MVYDIKVSLAQIEVKTGDIIGNTERIKESINKAISDKSDIIVFPETAITGYCCGSLFNNDFFIKHNLRVLNDIAKATPKNLHIFIGFVDFKGLRKDGIPEISNSVAILNDGKIIYTYDKQFMANGNHHEDKKYFLPGTRTTVAEITIKDQVIKVGTPICEDVWSQDHVRNIPSEMKSLGAEMLVVCNQSYFTIGKQITRDTMYSDHVKNLKIPIIQVNAVGVGDIVKNIIIFDGGSSTYLHEEHVFGTDVKMLSLDRFKPDYKSFNLNQYNKHNNVLEKYDEIFKCLVYTQQEFFKNIGIKNAQVHLSGGLDSSIVACIVKEAMGSENTIFITNPTTCNSKSTKDFAKYTADKLGVKLYWNQFESSYQTLLNSFETGISETVNPIVKSTFHAVGRTVQGLAAANHFKSGIVATGNFVENILGFCNFHDIGSIGTMSIIGDLTKIECYKLAKWLNEVYYKDVIIPEELYNGKFAPMAELPDTDGKADPFDYWVVSGICEDLIRNRKSKYQIVEEFEKKSLIHDQYPNDFDGKSIYDRITLEKFSEEVARCCKLMRISVFKAAQHAPNVLLNGRSRGFSNRETIINHYIY